MTYAREAMRRRLSLVMLIIGILVGLLGCAPAQRLSYNPHVAQGAELDKQQKWPEAIVEYTQGIQQDPKDDIAYDRRGSAYYYRGEYAKSIADYNQAIELNKGQEPIEFYMRGLSRQNLGMTEAALDDFTHAITLGYDHANAYIARGRAYTYKGLKAEAVADFTRAIERDATGTLVYGLRGIALVHLKRYQEALPDFDRYLPSTPGDVRALRWQGEAFVKTGQTDRARENVRKLIELDPRLAVNFSGDRALDLYDLEKRRAMAKQALIAAQEAASNGRWPEAFQQYERARTWVTGETEKDRTDITTILEGLRRVYAKLATKPDLPEAARRFGVQAVSVAEQKQYGEAVVLYEKALGVAPWWPDGHFNSALLLADRHVRGADWLRALRPAWGMALLVVVVLPWFVAIGIATDGQFFRDSLGGDLGGKLAGGAEAHWGPPGYYLLVAPLLLFPLTVPVLVALPFAWRGRADGLTRFLLAWVGPMWLVLEVVPTKLPHYVLPLFPALLLLASRWVVERAADPERLRAFAGSADRWMGATAIGACVIAGLGLALGGLAVPWLLRLDPLYALLVGVPALLAGYYVLRLAAAALDRDAWVCACIAMPLVTGVLLGLVLPALEPVWISPRVVASLKAHWPDGRPPGAKFGSYGFHEPSLVFLAGTDTALPRTAAEAAAFLAADPAHVLLVADRQRTRFEAEAARVSLVPRVVGEVSGFNYAGGRRVVLTLFGR